MSGKPRTANSMHIKPLSDKELIMQKEYLKKNKVTKIKPLGVSKGKR